MLRQIVKKYSDFVAYPIHLSVLRKEEGDDVAKTERGDEPLNSMKAIWTRPASDVSEEEYAEFYTHVTHDHRPPALRIATKIEGTFEATALLYVPSVAPFDLYHREMAGRGIQLYVRRVFIMDECRDLMPEWLRFVKGVVDAEDISLNVSREMLQQDRQIQAIRKHLVKKVVEALRDLEKDDNEKYLVFWSQFGPVVKEGLLGFEEKKDRILDLIQTASSRDATALTTLAEYVERMPEDQEAIYYMTGASRALLARSPHLEAFKAKGIEVLFFTDPVDDVWLEQMPPKYKEKTFRSIGRGEIELGTEDEEGGRGRAQAGRGDLPRPHRVPAQRRAGRREGGALVESPHGLAGLPRARRGRAQSADRGHAHAGRPGRPETKPILEINAHHPILEKLQALFEADGTDPRLGEYAGLLYAQAVLAEGGQPRGPGRRSPSSPGRCCAPSSRAPCDARRVESTDR